MLSRAQLVRYPHADMSALASRLAASTARRKLIATDAVFSMDGDVAPVPALLELAERTMRGSSSTTRTASACWATGRGMLAHFGLRSDRIVYMATLGKAAGVAGAFVCAHPAVIETIVQGARPYIYTTAAPAMLACALLASLDAIAHGECEARTARALDRRLRAGLIDVAVAIAALGHADPAARRRRQRRRDGAVGAVVAQRIFVPAIRPPTVPPGTARLRISLSAAHADADIDALVAALRAAC